MEDFYGKRNYIHYRYFIKKVSQIIQRTDAQKVPVLFYIYKKTTKVKKGKFYAKQKEQLQ